MVACKVIKKAKNIGIFFVRSPLQGVNLLKSFSSNFEISEFDCFFFRMMDFIALYRNWVAGNYVIEDQ